MTTKISDSVKTLNDFGYAFKGIWPTNRTSTSVG